MRICIAKNCGWSGLDEQCVHPKHNDTMILCPECYEVTEIMETNDYWSAEYKQRILDELAELREALEAAGNASQQRLEMLERVGRWYKANSVKYQIAEDVWALLNRQGVDVFGGEL